MSVAICVCGFPFNPERDPDTGKLLPANRKRKFCTPACKGMEHDRQKADEAKKAKQKQYEEDWVEAGQVMFPDGFYG